jgi:hypothetical protein
MEKLHNEKLHNVYSMPIIVRMIKYLGTRIIIRNKVHDEIRKLINLGNAYYLVQKL